MEQEVPNMVYSEREYLEAIRRNEPASTAEVADSVGVTRQGADYRLRQLENDGLVTSKMVGNSLIWMAVAEPDEVAESEQTSNDSSPAEQTRPAEPADTRRDGVGFEDILEGWPPEGQQKREQRHQAGLAALEYIRDVGAATAGDVKEAVEPDAPVDGQSADTWWRKSARPTLERARDAGLVTYTDGSKVWKWAAERDDTPAESGVYDPTKEF